MNDSAAKVSASPLMSAVYAAVVAGAIGFFGGQYNNNSSAQSAELQAHDRDIEHLKASALNDESGITRLESIVASTQTNVNALVSQFGILKTTLDAQTEGFHALQKQVGDQDRDRWLRPDSSPPVSPRR